MDWLDILATCIRSPSPAKRLTATMKARFASGGKGGVAIYLLTGIAGSVTGCNHSIDALVSIDASTLDIVDSGDGQAGDAANDALMADAGGGDSSDGGSESGGDGGDGGDGSRPSTCDMLVAMYEAALPLAKVCSIAATLPQCQTTAAEPIGCPCKTNVQDDSQLTAINDQWNEAGCIPVCPPSCASVETGQCQIGVGAAETCHDVP
jgi:hypothetical protein